MKELGHFIKTIHGKKTIMVRGFKNGSILETIIYCLFNARNACSEDCELLKFEQNEVYDRDEFDVTFKCIDCLHCSLLLED